VVDRLKAIRRPGEGYSDVILRLVASSGSGMEGACASYSLQLAHIAMMLAARQSVTVERPRSSSI
jgi:hypothetical protein